MADALKWVDWLWKNKLEIGHFPCHKPSATSLTTLQQSSTAHVNMNFTSTLQWQKV